MVSFLKINKRQSELLCTSLFKQQQLQPNLFLMMQPFDKTVYLIVDLGLRFMYCRLMPKLGCTIMTGKGKLSPRLSYLHSDITYFLAVQHLEILIF